MVQAFENKPQNLICLKSSRVKEFYNNCVIGYRLIVHIKVVCQLCSYLINIYKFTKDVPDFHQMFYLFNNRLRSVSRTE